MGNQYGDVIEAVRVATGDEERRRGLFLYAYARVRSIGVANELVEESIRGTLEGKTPWRPEVQPDVMRHLEGVVAEMVEMLDRSLARRGFES